MKYQQPFDQTSPDAGYVDGNPVTGVSGSIPRAAGIEHPQREIVEVISFAGLVPTSGDLKQLRKAIGVLIDKAIESFKTVILRSTPDKARQARAFTAGAALSNFPGGGGLTVVQSLSITGATYVDLTGYVAFRAASATGADCSARFRITGGGTSVLSDYLGCRPSSGTQIPTPLRSVFRDLNPATTYLIEIVVSRAETENLVAAYDPLIFAMHNGN